jgi:predicted nucleic acid-binding protein
VQQGKEGVGFDLDPRRRAVVIDTNALYAMPLADTLLRAADRDLYDFLWTADITRELRETMLRQGFPRDAVDRRVTAMQRAFRNTEVTGYEEQIPQLQLPDPDDRHVLAAAIHAEAEVVVTANVKDFPSDILAGFALSALTPDDFLTDLTRAFPQQLLEIVQEQAAAMRQPPMTFETLTKKLAEYAPAFGAMLRELHARTRRGADQSAAPDVTAGEQPTGQRIVRDHHDE